MTPNQPEGRRRGCGSVYVAGRHISPGYVSGHSRTIISSFSTLKIENFVVEFEVMNMKNRWIVWSGCKAKPKKKNTEKRKGIDATNYYFEWGAEHLIPLGLGTQKEKEHFPDGFIHRESNSICSKGRICGLISDCNPNYYSDSIPSSPEETFFFFFFC